MLTKTEAIVLRSMKFRDTSKIVTFYTRQFGKLKGIAKGARRPDNKFGSSLEPLSHVSLLLYKKEQRDLHLISQCDTIRSFRAIQKSIDGISVGLSVLELVDMLAHDEEENTPIFSLIVETLSTLDISPDNPQSLGRMFQLRLAAHLGYAPSLDVCAQCGRSLSGVEGRAPLGFHLLNGAMLCSECNRTSSSRQSRGYRQLSPPAHKILLRLLTSKIEAIPFLLYGEAVGNEIDETLRLYLRYHFEHMKDLKSARVFRSVT